MYRSEPPVSQPVEHTATSPVVGWARPQHRTPVRRDSQAPRRLNKCMFLEYDTEQGRWRDALHRTGRAERPPVALTPRREPERARSGDARALKALQVPAWENPVVIGLLLAVCPPVGVTMAWSAQTIPQAGRIALTVFGAFVMIVATTVAALLLL